MKKITDKIYKFECEEDFTEYNYTYDLTKNDVYLFKTKSEFTEQDIKVLPIGSDIEDALRLFLQCQYRKIEPQLLEDYHQLCIYENTKILNYFASKQIYLTEYNNELEFIKIIQDNNVEDIKKLNTYLENDKLLQSVTLKFKHFMTNMEKLDDMDYDTLIEECNCF